MSNSQGKGLKSSVLGALGIVGLVALLGVVAFVLYVCAVFLALMGVKTDDMMRGILLFGVAILGLAVVLAAVSHVFGDDAEKRNFFDRLGDFSVLKIVAAACMGGYLAYYYSMPDDRLLSPWEFNALVVALVAVFGSFAYDVSEFRKPSGSPGQKLTYGFGVSNAYDFSRRSRDHLVESALERVDVTDVERVRFFPVGGNSFSINTPKMKKIVRLVTTKLGKTEFAPEELRDYFERFAFSAQSDLAPEMIETILEKTDEFVRS